MPRSHRGTTTQAGYGWTHQQDRARLLAAHIDGTRCAHCGRPMYRSQKLQADHSKPRALGGQRADRLLHASCNLSRGATLGNQLRGAHRRRTRHGQAGTTTRGGTPPTRALPQW